MTSVIHRPVHHRVPRRIPTIRITWIHLGNEYFLRTIFTWSFTISRHVIATNWTWSKYFMSHRLHRLYLQIWLDRNSCQDYCFVHSDSIFSAVYFFSRRYDFKEGEKRGRKRRKKKKRKATLNVWFLGPVTRSRSSINPRRIGGRVNVLAVVQDTFPVPTWCALSPAKRLYRSLATCNWRIRLLCLEIR